MPINPKLSEAELQKLIPLIEQTKWSYKLDQYGDAASKEIAKSVQRARVEISQHLQRYGPQMSGWKKERYEALSEELQHLTLAAQSKIVGGITQATEIAGAASYAAQNNILSFGGLVPHFNPVTLSAAQLHSMVTTTPIGGRQLNEWVQRTFATDIQESIKSELLTGMLKGESYRDMVNRFGDKVYDGLSHNMETLTKSYVQSANVTAMDDVMKANADIVKGWKWNSVCENRTCMSCLSLDSRDEVYPLGEGPEMPQHPRCRCFKEIITKTFREIGVNVDEIEKAYRPYTIRGTVDPITGAITPGKIGVGGGRIIETGRFLGTYEDFLKGQSAAVQRQILGPSRLELWQSGKVKLMDFADKNGNIKLLTELKPKVFTLKNMPLAVTPEGQIIKNSIEVPFTKIGEHSNYNPTSAKFKEARDFAKNNKSISTMDIDINKLIPTEAWVSRGTVQSILDDFSWEKYKLSPAGNVQLPRIVKFEGKYYIHDGHNRLTASKLMGKKRVPIQLIDMDIPTIKLKELRGEVGA